MLLFNSSGNVDTIIAKVFVTSCDYNILYYGNDEHWPPVDNVELNVLLPDSSLKAVVLLCSV